MKASQQLLRFCTIAFFVIMVAGPVLYRCGTFKKPAQSTDAPGSAFMKAMSKPWFDSTAFKNELGSVDHIKMYSSKSGPPFALHPKDTQSVLQLLEMRYEMSRMNEQDILVFQKTFSRIDALQLSWPKYGLPRETQDSIHALLYASAGSAGLSRLTPVELKIVNADLRDRQEQKKQQGMTPYLGFVDTLNALKVLKTETSRK